MILCLYTAIFSSILLIFSGAASIWKFLLQIFNDKYGCLYIVFAMAAFSMTWSLFRFLKQIMNIGHRKRQTETYERSRNSILIGLVLIAVFASLGRFNVLGSDNANHWTLCSLFYAIFIIQIYRIFLHKDSKPCDWTNTLTAAYGFYYCMILVIHLFGFCYIIRYNTDSDIVITCYKIGFALILTSSTLEIYGILMGKMGLKENTENGIEVLKIVVKRTFGTQTKTSDAEDVEEKLME